MLSCKTNYTKNKNQRYTLRCQISIDLYNLNNLERFHLIHFIISKLESKCSLESIEWLQFEAHTRGSKKQTIKFDK